MALRIVLRPRDGDRPAPPTPHPDFEQTRQALLARRRELDRETDAFLAGKRQERDALLDARPSGRP